MQPGRELVRHVRNVDFPGTAGFLVALWGLTLVVRGSVAVSVAPHRVDGARLVVVGTVLLAGVGVFLWSRLLRRAALTLLAPAVLSIAACLLTPGIPFPLLALGMTPAACAAAGTGMGPRGDRDRRLVVWVFAATAIMGEPGTGAFALAAAMFVVVCSLLGPDPLRFATPWIPAVPDDVAGL